MYVWECVCVCVWKVCVCVCVWNVCMYVWKVCECVWNVCVCMYGNVCVCVWNVCVCMYGKCVSVYVYGRCVCFHVLTVLHSQWYIHNCYRKVATNVIWRLTQYPEVDTSPLVVVRQAKDIV